MISTLRSWSLTILIVMSVSLSACERIASPQTPTDQHAQDDGHDGESATGTAGNPSDRIAIPATVRSNLGISFVQVERRRVEQTLRVPGRFEYLPTARREYRTPVSGRVELLVEQFDRVKAGQPLYRIDSPDWREMQQLLADATSQIERFVSRRDTFEPLLAAHHQHEESLQESVQVWNERLEQLQLVRETGGGRIDDLAQARASLALTRADLANVLEKKAELTANHQQTIADLSAARDRLEYLLDAAVAVVLRPRGELTKLIETDQTTRPGWAMLTTIEVRATEAGAVELLGLTNGSWADESALVLSVVQPERLRFRASGLQSDLGVLRDGLPARIVPPTPTAAGRAIHLTETMTGTLALGLAGDPNARTLDLFVVPDNLKPWARPGISAQLEIVTDSTDSPELAIPLAAVQRDGLTPIIFRRDPANPDEAIRIEADLGKDDGRWVALLSGVRDGDEIVLDGAFQLMLATTGSIQKGGHFHSDGTFHEGED